jgi:hypothetical protein
MGRLSVSGFPCLHLCREFVELIDPDAVRGEISRKNFTSARRDDVAMRRWNLLNEAMRPEAFNYSVISNSADGSWACS